jgi:archaellum component FlaC
VKFLFLRAIDDKSPPMVACMAVMARERWTDEQLDKAFGRIDGDLRELRVEMRKGFEQIDKRFEEMDKRFDQIDLRFEQVDKRFEQVDKRFEQVDKRFEAFDKRFEAFDFRFDSVQRNMLIGLITINATFIGGLLALHP